RDVPYGRPASSDSPKPMVAQVSRVLPGSKADLAGLRPGDVIIQADGHRMPKARTVGQSVKDGSVILLVRRGQSSFYAALKR
ncbi:MAG: hypothetical protein CSA75_04155, partial [Sorangium cellulosum]